MKNIKRSLIPHVREAVCDDIPYIMEQLQDFSDFFESKYSLFGNAKYIEQGLETLINDHLFLVAYSESCGLMGFISGFFVPHVFNPEIQTLAETFWWVSKEHRKTRTGLLLLNKFIDWGKQNGANWITMTLEQKSPVNERSLIKRGFHLHEKNYLMEII